MKLEASKHGDDFITATKDEAIFEAYKSELMQQFKFVGTHDI